MTLEESKVALKASMKPQGSGALTLRFRRPALVDGRPPGGGGGGSSSRFRDAPS